MNLGWRLKEFATLTAEFIEVLFTVPGTSKDEARFHRLFSNCRLRGEHFRNDGDLFNFIDRVKHFGFDYAWQLLLEDQPERLRQRQLDQHRRKTVKQLRKKKDLDAYYAGLVAERKKRLGW